MRKNIKNEKVVRAIAVGIASMMAMNPVTVLAAETPETPADSVSATPIVMPTEIPSISVTPATPNITPAPATTGEENDTQLNNAKDEIKDASDAAGEVKAPILQIPLQGPAQGAAIVAGGYVEAARKELTEDDQEIDKLLDKSVEGQGDLGYQGSNADDTVAADINAAAAALGRYEELDIDETIEVATSELEGVTTSSDARQIAAGLNDAATAATTELDAANEDLVKAYGDLRVAEADYEKALGISDKAVEDAQKALDAAMEKVEEAEDRVNKAKDRVDKIDALLDSVQDTIDRANENLQQEIIDAKDDLAIAEAKLKEDVKKLQDATYAEGGLVDKANNFATQVGLLGDAVTAFAKAIDNASTTEEQLKTLRRQYEDALLAYNQAKDDYNAAVDELGKLDEVTEADVEKLKGISDDADTEASKAIKAMNAYEDQDYANKLQAALDAVKEAEEGTEDYTPVGQLVIEKYLAKKGDVVCEVKWVPGNCDKDGNLLEGVTETPYGKSVDGFYVLVSTDADGNEVVKDRYGINVKEGVLTVATIDAQNTTNYYKYEGTDYPIFKDGNNQQYIDVGEGDNSKHIYIKDDEGDKYFESEIEKGSRTEIDLTGTPSIVLTGSALSELKDALKHFGIDINIPSITIDSDSVKNGSYNYYGIKFKIEKNSDGSYTVKKKKLFSSDYVPMDKVGVTTNYPNKTIPQVKAKDGKSYDINYTEKDGYYYVDSNENVWYLIKSGDDFVVKTPVEFVSGGDANTFYSVGDPTAVTSDKYANEYQALVDAYYGNKEKNIQGALAAQQIANKNYSDAVEAYNAYQDALNLKNEALAKKNEKEKAFKEKDLVAGLVKVDLAALPVDLGDIFSVEKIMKMPENEREELVAALKDVLTGKIEIKDLTAFVDTFKMLGMPNILTIGEVYSISKTPDYLLSSFNITSYERDYAKAWINAWMAKLNVVTTGVEMISQAGTTANAGMELIGAGINEAGKATTVTLDALEVAIRAAAIGGMQLGSDVLVFASNIVGDFDEVVEQIQSELKTAQDEILEAKSALATIKLKNPKASELAEAEKALKDAEARYADILKRFNDASAERDRAKKLAEEAEEVADKLAKEEAARRSESQGGGDGYRGGSSESGMIENAILYTEDDIALFAQRIADQAVLGARRNIARTGAGDDNQSGVAGVRVDKNNTDDTKPVVREKEEVKSESVKIVDEETPLAAAPIEKKNMNWWWLIVVAALGATGYELYRKHEEKKQAEGNIADSLKKEN